MTISCHKDSILKNIFRFYILWLLRSLLTFSGNSILRTMSTSLTTQWWRGLPQLKLFAWTLAQNLQIFTKYRLPIMLNVTLTEVWKKKDRYQPLSSESNRKTFYPPNFTLSYFFIFFFFFLADTRTKCSPSVMHYRCLELVPI